MEGVSQNTAVTLTLNIKQEAWTFLGQGGFKNVSMATLPQ